jgi:transposase
MRILYKNVAGLDVHKKTIVAAVVVLGVDGSWQTAKRTFGSMTAELLALSDWLLAFGCDPCGYGEHRRILETGLQHPGEHL